MAGAALQMIHCWRLQVGRLGVMLASGPQGACRVGLTFDGGQEARDYFQVFFPGVELRESLELNRPLAAAVKAALAGRPKDRRLKVAAKFKGFQTAVLDYISGIPYGETETYGQVAAGLGRPRAARAVGQALKANPLPIVYP